MTAANMAAHQKDEWYDFWKNLKEGYDYFEITHLPPRIAVCEKHYLVNAAFVDRGAQARSRQAPVPRGRDCRCRARRPSRWPRPRRRQDAAAADEASRQRARPDLRTVEARLSRLHAWSGDAADADAGSCAGAGQVTRDQSQKSEARGCCILTSGC